MKLRITGPQRVNGTVSAPPSKAYTHRALIGALLTRGETTVDRVLDCDDTRLTLRGIQQLGAKVSVDQGRGSARIEGPVSLAQASDPIVCGESGASLRFLMAVVATQPHSAVLLAGRRLSERPIWPMVDALEQLGASLQIQHAAEGIRAVVRGPLKGGLARLPGTISSQFISGLLLASPCAEETVEIEIEGKLESRPYVNMTLSVMRKHGIRIEERKDGFRVERAQDYRPTNHWTPGDFSSATFILTAAETAGDQVTIEGLDGSSLEPDSAILGILAQAGGKIERRGGRVSLTRSGIRAFDFDASDNPDLVPALEVLASAADGKSVIRGVKRLKYKESNRLHTVRDELGKMGGRISLDDDMITVEGPRRLVGAELSSHNDHRVAMACTVASLMAEGHSSVDGVESVSKSYPGFFDDLRKLGVGFDVE